MRYELICGDCFEKMREIPNHKVLKKIIEIASNENSIVLDCFGGVNSTGEAALQLNRRYIGIEINPVYYQASVNRLKKYGERVE